MWYRVEPRCFTVDDSGDGLHTLLDLGALHEQALSGPWPRGISAEDISVKIASGVKRLRRCAGGRWRSFVRHIDSTCDPITLL